MGFAASPKGELCVRLIGLALITELPCVPPHLLVLLAYGLTTPSAFSLNHIHAPGTREGSVSGARKGPRLPTLGVVLHASGSAGSTLSKATLLRLPGSVNLQTNKQTKMHLVPIGSKRKTALLLLLEAGSACTLPDYAPGLRPRPHTAGDPSGPKTIRTSAIVRGRAYSLCYMGPHCKTFFVACSWLLGRD